MTVRVVGIVLVAAITARCAADESDKPSPFSGGWGTLGTTVGFSRKDASWADVELAPAKRSPLGQITSIPRIPAASKPDGDARRFERARFVVNQAKANP